MPPIPPITDTRPWIFRPWSNSRQTEAGWKGRIKATTPATSLGLGAAVVGVLGFLFSKESKFGKFITGLLAVAGLVLAGVGKFKYSEALSQAEEPVPEPPPQKPPQDGLGSQGPSPEPEPPPSPKGGQPPDNTSPSPPSVEQAKAPDAKAPSTEQSAPASDVKSSQDASTLDIKQHIEQFNQLSKKIEQEIYNLSLADKQVRIKAADELQKLIESHTDTTKSILFSIVDRPRDMPSRVMANTVLSFISLLNASEILKENGGSQLQVVGDKNLSTFIEAGLASQPAHYHEDKSNKPSPPADSTPPLAAAPANSAAASGPAAKTEPAARQADQAATTEQAPVDVTGEDQAENPRLTIHIEEGFGKEDELDQIRQEDERRIYDEEQERIRLEQEKRRRDDDDDLLLGGAAILDL